MRSRANLASTQLMIVPKDVVAATGDTLRAFGARGCEGLVLWAGTISNDVARVAQGIVPPQQPIRDEGGVGYFVDGESLFELNVHLHRRGLLLLAQVHSHPAEAYHSEADDRYAIVTTEGGFSLVAPDFGDAFEISSCAVYRLDGGEWVPLSDDEIRAQIHVE